MTSHPLPALFLAHGTPMLALAEDAYTHAIQDFVRTLPKPKAIVIVSAYGSTEDSLFEVSAAAQPRLIYDFGGFPSDLYLMEYPCPGDPALAARVAGLLSAANFSVALNNRRGLDHGVWIPLKTAFPNADIPVIQISVPAEASPREFLKLGHALAPLREENVLLVGSGGAVYNLDQIVWFLKSSEGADWAREFEAWVKDRLLAKDVESLVEFRENGPRAELAHPTEKHFLPLLFTIGAARKGDEVTKIFEGIQYHSLSMLSFALEPPVPLDRMIH